MCGRPRRRRCAPLGPHLDGAGGLPGLATSGSHKPSSPALLQDTLASLFEYVPVRPLLVSHHVGVVGRHCDSWASSLLHFFFIPSAGCCSKRVRENKVKCLLSRLVPWTRALGVTVLLPRAAACGGLSASLRAGVTVPLSSTVRMSGNHQEHPTPGARSEPREVTSGY